MNAILLIAALAFSGAAAAAEPARQRSFASAEAAVAALGASVEKNERAAIAVILGDKGMHIVNSGDRIIDASERASFLHHFRKRHEIESDGEDRAVLLLGDDDLPFPIPLVARSGRWRFDDTDGHEDILSRRIGKTERFALDFMLQLVRGQRAYFETARDPGGVHEYARRFVGDATRRDGLVWITGDGRFDGPLADLGRAAYSEGYRAEIPIYRGYRFRSLDAQGPNAVGGARNYIVNGRRTQGFAILACPTRYAVSGVLSYVVNQEGVVYDKDLGRRTAEICKSMRRFDPDSSWNRGVKE